VGAKKKRTQVCSEGKNEVGYLGGCPRREFYSLIIRQRVGKGGIAIYSGGKGDFRGNPILALSGEKEDSGTMAIMKGLGKYRGVKR